MQWWILLYLISFVDIELPLDSNEEALPAMEALPAPTEEVMKLIEDLGADKYAVREHASKELRALGRAAILGLDVESDKTRDREIQIRAAEILDNYYLSAVFEDGQDVQVADRINPLFRFDAGNDQSYYETLKIPSIWTLSKKIRYVENKDLADEYYLKAAKIYNESVDLNQIVDVNNKKFRVVECYATYLFIEEKMRQGLTMIDAKYLLNQMRLRDYRLLLKPKPNEKS